MSVGINLSKQIMNLSYVGMNLSELEMTTAIISLLVLTNGIQWQHWQMSDKNFKDYVYRKMLVQEYLKK